jgi:hypothetical protein
MTQESHLGQRTFKTKAKLAFELVKQSICNGILFNFGEQSWLFEALEDKGVTYVEDIAKDTRIFLRAPTVSVQALEEDRFKMSIQGEGAITVDSLVKEGRVAFLRCTA